MCGPTGLVHPPCHTVSLASPNCITGHLHAQHPTGSERKRSEGSELGRVPLLQGSKVHPQVVGVEELVPSPSEPHEPREATAWLTVP